MTSIEEITLSDIIRLRRLLLWPAKRFRVIEQVTCWALLLGRLCYRLFIHHVHWLRTTRNSLGHRGTVDNLRRRYQRLLLLPCIGLLRLLLLLGGNSLHTWGQLGLDPLRQSERLDNDLTLNVWARNIEILPCIEPYRLNFL